MGFPVFLKHSPSFRDNAVASISHLTWSTGVCANEVCAANETCRHASTGKTVKLRRSPPDKNTIVRTSLFDDLLDNRQKMKRLRSHCERHNQKACCWQSGDSDDASAQPSPACLRIMSPLFGYKARERLAGKDRQRRKHCQMIMPRKSPSNKDCEVAKTEP